MPLPAPLLPTATPLQKFIGDELIYSYGPGQVASVNPVWNQDLLDGLLREYNEVGVGMACTRSRGHDVTTSPKQAPTFSSFAGVFHNCLRN